MRLVSLTCSNTEIVCALGCADMLVAVDDHSDFPTEVVAALPRVGPDLNIDVARVADLDPDLVLASLTVPGHEKVVAAIEDADLESIAPSPESLEDVYQDIRTIADRLGVRDRGEALVTDMRAEIVPRSHGDPRPRVLVEWWPKPVIVPGRRSWVTDLLDAAGGTNPFGTREVLSTPVEPEEVLAASPDAVVISWCGVEPRNYRPSQVYGRNQWRGVPALEKRRVHCVPEAFLGRPGPRLVEGYRALSDIVAQCAEESEN